MLRNLLNLLLDWTTKQLGLNMQNLNTKHLQSQFLKDSAANNLMLVCEHPIIVIACSLNAWEIHHKMHPDESKKEFLANCMHTAHEHFKACPCGKIELVESGLAILDCHAAGSLLVIALNELQELDTKGLILEMKQHHEQEIINNNSKYKKLLNIGRFQGSPRSLKKKLFN
jgi:hypothetical protein